jgi:hypothetical protein
LLADLLADPQIAAAIRDHVARMEETEIGPAPLRL